MARYPGRGPVNTTDTTDVVMVELNVNVIT